MRLIHTQSILRVKKKKKKAGIKKLNITYNFRTKTV